MYTLLLLGGKEMAQDFAKKFYKSKKWKRVRDYVMKRDSWLCQIPECYAPAEEVHHKIHLTASNIDDPEISLNPKNLMSICRTHHFEHHKKDKGKAISIANKKRAREQNQEKEKILQEILFDADGFPIKK